MMKDRIQELVDGMLHPNATGTTVAESVAARAYQVVESTTDPELLRAAKDAVLAEEDKLRRRTLYLIIRKLGRNLNDPDVGPFLIRQLPRESDKYVLMFLLDGIADLPKPKDTDLAPILMLLNHPKWQVRHSAIEALKQTESSVAEQALIGVLQSSTDPGDLISANATLNRIGTLRAIPAIELHLGSRKPDVKMSAQFAIDEIQKRKTSTI